MILPNFLIIGAQKAGTTTLYRLLRAHPAIFLPEQKEPGFFIRAFPDPVRFQTLRRPDDGRHATTIGSRGGGAFTLDEYTALFVDGARSPLRGEASTPYLPSPFAAARIAEVIPDARLIALLRDPVERAYSAYTYNLSRGMEPAKTFADAVDSELGGERDDWVYGWRYLYTGLYARHLRRFLDYFPRDRIQVLRFEDLRADAGALCAQVCRFLGVEGAAPPPTAVHNATALPRNQLMRRLKNTLTTPNPLKRAARIALPAGLRRRVNRLMLRAVDRFGVRPPPMPREMRERLADYYREANGELAALLGTDFAGWGGHP